MGLFTNNIFTKSTYRKKASRTATTTTNYSKRKPPILEVNAQAMKTLLVGSR